MKSNLSIEEAEKRLFDIANELGVDVMDNAVIKEYFNRYEKVFPHSFTREILSLYADASAEDCKPINPKRKRVGDGYHTN